jgi:hypothetical protein
MIPSPEARCPFDHKTLTDQRPSYVQLDPPEDMPDPESLRQHMFDWYQKTGFRGCLFNKVAARDARRGDFTWHVPVEYETVDELLEGDGGRRVLDNFEALVGAEGSESLVSYMFPNVETPRELGDLLKYLHYSDPERFQLFETVDRERIPEFDNQEFVGIQFRVKTGVSEDGEDILAYPMIYNPWEFTTFARRFDVPKITFNPTTSKQNPETSDTYIGVDDIDLSSSLTPGNFEKMLERSLAVNRQAHSADGQRDDTFHYSRKLFRAHNALVLPASAWED